MTTDHRQDPSTVSGRPAFRRRLWVRLLSAYLLPTAVIVAGIGFIAYRAARLSLEEQLGQELTAIARQAADLAARPWILELAPGDEGSRTFRNLQQKLKRLREVSGTSVIFLFDEKERALVDSESRVAIGQAVPWLAADRAELAAVFAGEPRASPLFWANDGLPYMTGFAPVRLDGQVRAAVGVEGSARFFAGLVELRRTLLLAAASALLLVALVTVLVSRRITGPLRRLSRAARAIGAGELHQEIVPETGDEIGLLAATLNDMRRSLEARDRQLQMMLSGIAHEVRNPLGGMELFAGLLREELADHPHAQSHLARITTELQYLARVVTDFLDFARKKPLTPEATDPRTLLEEVAALCRPAAEKAGVSLEIENRAAGPVRWDAERIRRVILNLAQNAIQASSTGQRVVLSAGEVDGGVRLEVRDQGRGIPPEAKSRIFEPFFTTRQQGTGLGLALAHKIVSAHGGRLEFESTLGQGTRFWAWLPREASGAEREDAWPAS
ncbi:MAG: HAMP domain-containing histidine kinase [Myxococcales bacterium]|nr:HAMP domain-containing histidine kinase [Myxococcales bacterium]